MLSSVFNQLNLKLMVCLFLFCSAINAFAQKSDEIQEGNIWVSTIKVDGKITEWQTPLKATNRSTNLSYTLGNDGKFLYLAIQSKDLINNNKILLGGITFSVNLDGKKKSKDGFSLTFPVINRQRNQNGQRTGGQRTFGQGGGGGFGQPQQRTQAQRDSMQIARAKTQLAAAKEIKVFGVKSITDSLISIYNEYGIKASSSINDTGILTYELAIPLDLLQLSINKLKEFAYNIKLNGLQMNGFGGGGGFNGGGNMDFQALISPTDLWGKYTLATQ
jgi:hypothetical protein